MLLDGVDLVLCGEREKSPSCDLCQCLCASETTDPCPTIPKCPKGDTSERQTCQSGMRLFPQSQLWKLAGNLSIYHPPAPNQGDVSLEQNNSLLQARLDPYNQFSIQNLLSYGEEECRKAGINIPTLTNAVRAFPPFHFPVVCSVLRKTLP